MCGIAGGVWCHGQTGLDARLNTALDCLKHRGPNDRGLTMHISGASQIGLGQTRLSVIDLSTGGHQPMLAADGSLAIVFNGEIYNYRELREQLRAAGHIFASASDTEVLLTAWAHWGQACLLRLEGMFAFVVHDRKAGTLTCVRDAFGIKPLFIAHEDDEFVFASEMRALLALRTTKPQPDLQRSYDYLANGRYDNNDRTFVAGVRHLLPGTILEIDLAGKRLPRSETWWRPPIVQTSILSFDDAAEAVREQFLANIRLHLRSDVPLGVALSGGIDSSTVVAAMRYVEPEMPIHTFSYIAESSDVSEEAWVDLVNAYTGAVPHKVTTSADDLLRDLDAIVDAQGEPFGSTSIYAQYRVYQLAKENGITVTLDGQGADELLAGYSGYPGLRMLSLYERGRLGKMHSFASQWARWPGRSYRQALMLFANALVPDNFYEGARLLVGRNSRRDWLDTPKLAEAGVTLAVERYGLAPQARQRRVVENLAHSLQVDGIPRLLRHGDRNSMAFSIESRVPFLTLPMAELLLSLPENYLISDTGETKSVFRAAMRGIVPNAILDRRDKIGFETPEKQWLLAIAPKLRQWLQASAAIPFLDRTALLKSFDAIVDGKAPFSWQLWRWVNYARWYELQGFGE